MDFTKVVSFLKTVKNLPGLFSPLNDLITDREAFGWLSGYHI